MTARVFADKLEAIANDIGDVPRHDLAVLLRRAARKASIDSCSVALSYKVP